MEPQLKKLQ